MGDGISDCEDAAVVACPTPSKPKAKSSNQNDESFDEDDEDDDEDEELEEELDDPTALSTSFNFPAFAGVAKQTNRTATYSRLPITLHPSVALQKNARA